MEYRDLDVWKFSRELVNSTYELTKSFPKEELYGLTNQIRRCAVSIPSNIAEGCGRRTSKDTIQFLYISRGSLYELETQLFLALDQDFINKSQLNEINTQIESCKKLLNGFIKYYKKL
ncbi:four helix bundle protein [Aequorivita echinoideorum]|uniref:Four helix bundle protein n=1 Tax=Aequorivita echinoideorum TaxID=1549647 RepID=A0ABS5S0C6_9FLAO|nr:four helix bundle protein [Aequorivita echinoideorum]MBT0606667.1 four helix bundle protein [Aequorivita echinoideorum]